ncbi:MAG: ABC transporter ATP-binding protein/permease [Burkholderiales bacterium]
MLATSRQFLHDLWVLARPYWFSEEKWGARGLLAIIVALNLGMVGIMVLLNQWNNAFYNTLQDKDLEGFYQQLLVFTGLAGAFILVAVYRLYLNQMLQIRWRRWLTERYLDEWIAHRTYYRLQLTDRETDNPDQRIADDLSLFVERTLSLSLGLLSAVVTLVSFVVILWGLSGMFSFNLGGREIVVPGYMVWVALVYAIIGTWLTHLIGRPLVGLNFNQQKYEANFRFSLVRVRENAEAIALYRGESGEIGNLRLRFSDVWRNWWEIMKRQKKLTWFNAGYNQIANIFPILVAAPRYFSGAIQLGGLMQTASAFGQVQDALSWFVNAYAQLAEWKATVDRLTTFHNAMRNAAAHQGDGVKAAAGDGAGLAAQDVALALPDGRALAEPFTLAIPPGTPLLVTGPSGAGKSTLFRAFAGIWPFGRGTVTQPRGSILFLPQKPYLPIGRLRDALAYPAAADAFTESALSEALAAVGLPALVARLEEEQHWTQVLSGGEQQRVAFARALLQAPDWLFLDEATSALDEASEGALYRLLAARLPHTTVVSIGHRSSLAALHPRRLAFEPHAGAPAVLAYTG